MNSKPGIYVVAILIVLAMLTACGGGSSAPGQPAAAITTQPTDQSVVSGTTATFTVAASNATGYQWQISTDSGSTFSDIAGATSAGYSTAITILADSGTRYRVVVAGAGNSVTSSAVTLTVFAAPVAPGISVHPANQTITEGQDAGFSVTATGTSLSYQWQRSTDGGGSFTNVPAATGSTVNLSAVPLSNSGHQFKVLVSNIAGSITSNAATLTVNAAQAAPVFTTQPVSVSITAGQSTQFTVAVTGTPAPTLQWQLSTDSGGSWGDIVGETGSTFNVIGAGLPNNGRQFRVVATNTVSTVTSNAATLTVTSGAVAPVFTLQPTDVTITEGQNAQFTVAFTGTPTPTVQWQLSTNDGLTWSNIVSATSNTLIVSSATLSYDGQQFHAVATNSENSATSDPALLTVNPTSALLNIVFTLGFGIQSGKDDLYLVKEDGTGEVPLAQTADNEMFAAVAPGGRVVYQRATGGQLDLYSVNSGGTDLQSLATTTYDESFSAITVSGRVIYRRDGESTGRDLWSVNADGTNTQVLANSAKHEDFVALTASGKVIYSEVQSDGTNDYYLVNADGSGKVGLATEPSYYTGFHGETPAGQLILEIATGFGTGGFYSVAQTGGPGTPLAINSAPDEYSIGGTTSITSTGQVIINRRVDGQRDLYGTSGSGLVSLATSTNYEQYMGSTATGKVIFSREVPRNGAGATQFDLFIVNADGTNLVSLTSSTTNDDYFGGVAPDGRIIYTSCGSIDGLCDLYAVNADGTGTVVLANSPTYQEFYIGITPSGRLIYSKENGVSTTLYAVNTDGTGTNLLPGGPFLVATTSNDKVLIRNQNNGNANLYIVNADGTGSTPLANTGNNEFFNAVLP